MADEFPRDNLVRAVDGGVEFREDTHADGRIGTLHGRFTPLGDWTEINSAFEGNFMERFAPGALKKTVAENRDGMRVLFQHGRDPQIGDKPLGPIEKLSADAEYEVPLIDTSYNRDLLPGLKAGLYGASFRFAVVKEELKRNVEPSDYNPKGLPERTVTEARVMEFGPVTFPAYANATAGVRSLTDEFREPYVTVELERSPLTSADAPTALEPEPAAATQDPVKDDEPEHSDTSRATPEPDKPQTKSEQTEEKMHDYRSVEEIDGRLEEIKETLSEISKEFGVRALDTEAQGRWDSLIEERGELERDKKSYEERQAYLREIAETKPAARVLGAGSNVARANREAAPENVFDLTEYHTRSNSQEHMTRMLNEGAERAIDGFEFPNPMVDQAETKQKVKRLLNGDRGSEIQQRLLIHGSPVYRSAFWKHVTGRPLNREEQAKLAEGMELESRAISTANTGGVTVPVTIDPTVLLTSNGAINPFRLVSSIKQITSHQYQGVTSTGISASYAAEAAVMSDNSPTLVAPAINPERANAFVPFSWEAAQDWTGLETDMSRLFADAKDILEATKFASGAGHASNEPQGVLTGAGTVVGSAATTVVGTVDIYALEQALPVRFQPNAVWLATPGLYSRIRQQTGIGAGGAAGIWADSLQVGQPGRLLGYPAYKASTVGTAGNNAVNVASTKWGIFGDFSNFAIVDRIGMQVKYVDTLFNGNTAGAIAYPNGQAGLILYWRNSSGVLASNAFRTGTVT